MRLGFLSVASGFLIRLGRGRTQTYEVIENPLPEDACIVGATLTEGGDVALIISSDEYPPFEAGKDIFRISEPILRSYDGAGWERGPMERRPDTGPMCDIHDLK